MPLPLPNLDDRDYEQLREAALKKIEENLDTNWNDLAPGDPGIVLLEAFVFLTEQMIYRLNRLPEKVYTAFLRLLGVNQAPPTAARVLLEISNEKDEKITLPCGTRVGSSDADGRPDQPVFLTAQEVKLPAAREGRAATVEVLAYQCEQVEEELGVSNGLPGQVFQVQQRPITAPLGNWLDLVVGLEVPPEERQSSDRQGSDGRFYRPWIEVDDFSESSDTSHVFTDIRPVFTVDRQMGTIQFAPAARRTQEKGASANIQIFAFRTGEKKLRPYDYLVGGGPLHDQPAWDPGQARLESGFRKLGAVPRSRQRIRMWYSRSVGEAGNLPAGKLTNVLDAPGHPELNGVKVTNPKAAWGGMDGEALADALVRGPYEAFARQNVITIRDYEAVVRRRGRAIARAHAYALRDLWNYAKPGTVEIALVPALPAAQRQLVKLPDLIARQDDHDFQGIETDLMEKTPVGTHSRLIWARYKQVSVEADLVLDKNTDAQKVKNAITQRLYDLISPLPALPKTNGSQPDGYLPSAGWPFGQELRVAQVYQAILAAEPRIRLIQRLVLKVEKAPQSDIHSLAADFFQPQTWYAGSGSNVFRSINDGAGWEMLTLKPKLEPRSERVAVIRPSPDRPGLIALATTQERRVPERRSALYISADCGETWHCHTREFSYEINDMAWMLRAAQPILLLATTCGLYELDIPERGDETSSTYAMPHLVPVVASDQELALNSVVVLRYRGNSRVAVAAKSRKGVFLSRSDDLIPFKGRWDPEDAEHLKTNFESLDLTYEGIDLKGLKDVDIRCLAVQTDLNHTYNFLWAGAMAIGDWARGCYRWRFDQLVLEPGSGTWVCPEDWIGGSCHALAFQGPRVLAATQSGGVLRVDFNLDNWDKFPPWKPLKTVQGPKSLLSLDGSDHLGSADQTGFEPLFALGTSPAGEVDKAAVIMTGGPDGIFRLQMGSGEDAEGAFERISRSEFRMMKDAVTIPSNWLLISGTHVISTGEESDKSAASKQDAGEKIHETH